MIERFKLTPQSHVVEVASNDGYLLQYFVERGIPCLGIEPAKNVAQVAIDLSGRPAFVFNVKFPRGTIGDFPVELVEEFFKDLCTSAKMNLHINVPYGTNNHHISEAIFKATAKAMSSADSAMVSMWYRPVTPSRIFSTALSG